MLLRIALSLSLFDELVDIVFRVYRCLSARVTRM